jgi:hypothetical protein
MSKAFDCLYSRTGNVMGALFHNDLKYVKDLVIE